MFENMGGNIPGGNFLSGNFPGGNCSRGSLMGGNFPDAFLEDLQTICSHIPVKGSFFNKFATLTA